MNKLQLKAIASSKRHNKSALALCRPSLLIWALLSLLLFYQSIALAADQAASAASSLQLFGEVGKFEALTDDVQQRDSFSVLVPRPPAQSAAKPPFTLNARRSQTLMEPGQAKFDRSKAPALFASISEAAKILSAYDVELIVDKSLSMRRRDCPGGLSRWEWCASQSQELGRQLAPFVPQGLTIVPFARLYDSYEHQQPEQIANMFYGTELQRGTRLAEPLADRLNRSIERRARGAKPTIIAIITDGIPAPAYEPQAVIDVLINASKQMRSREDVTVVFFQIGGQDPFGERYLYDLDNNLVSWGARFDFVQTVPFQHLQQVGLARALLDSIRALDTQPHN